MKLSVQKIKHTGKSVLAFFLAMLCWMLPACGEKDPENPADASQNTSTVAEDPYTAPGDVTDALNGINFAVSKARDRELNLTELFDLVQSIRAESVRNTVNFTSVLNADGSLREKQVNLQKQWIASLQKAGVKQIVGVTEGWLSPQSLGINDRNAVPFFNEDETSDFGKWIAFYEEQWYRVAKAFPEISVWEMGSGLNLDENLHPVNYAATKNTFTMEDKVEVILAMCYAARSGIKRANPNAIAVFPGIAVNSKSSADALKLWKKLYWYISGSGSSKGSDPDLFFDAIALQCYPAYNQTAAQWVEEVKSFLQVSAEKNDGEKKLYLTALGLSDGGLESKDRVQASLLEEMIRTAKDSLPQLAGIFPYQLLDDNTAANDVERYYGMFSVLGKNAFAVKEKGRALCRIYCGNEAKLDLYRDVPDPVDPQAPTGDATAKTVSYLCTWGRQSYAAGKLKLSGTGSSEMRDALNADALFSAANLSLYHIVPEAYRSELYFLLDDGWDVPKGTSQDGDRSEFGSMEPDPVKFASLGSTALERLTAMVTKSKELGYAGLGLWVSPQIPGESFTVTEAARSYWEEKAKLSADAGVSYWKVDWGKHQSDVAYRKMMTECVQKFAPDLIVEHAYTQTPFTQSNRETDFASNRKNAIRGYVTLDGSIRIYDLADPFKTVCALDRIDEIFRIYQEEGSTADVYVNAESEAYLAAVLGCSLGIMSFNSEMQAALNWQQNYAPAFSAKDAIYTASEDRLTDSFYFDREQASWYSCGNQTITESAPAVMARGIGLPEVETCMGSFTPFVAASRNPVTGAVSVGCFERTIDPNTTVSGLADVTLQVGKTGTPVGVFGIFGSLTLVFDTDLSAGVEVQAKDLLGNAATDLSALVTVNENSITIDGTVLRRIGKEARKDSDSSLPSLVLTVLPRS